MGRPANARSAVWDDQVTVASIASPTNGWQSLKAKPSIGVPCGSVNSTRMEPAALVEALITKRSPAIVKTLDVIRPASASAWIEANPSSRRVNRRKGVV